MLSGAFGPYMHKYVELERTSIGDVLRDIGSSEQWAPALDALPNEARYGGIDDLLGYIKSSIQRCGKIGTGEMLFKIHFEYVAGHEQYVGLVSKRVTALNAEIMAKKAGCIDKQLVALRLAVNVHWQRKW